MDNNTLLFQDKGSGRYKDVKIYPNRIEVLKKGTFWRQAYRDCLP